MIVGGTYYEYPSIIFLSIGKDFYVVNVKNWKQRGPITICKVASLGHLLFDYRLRYSSY